MSDQDQIREMQALWAELDGDHDAEGVSKLFTPDGRYISGRGEFVGREAIRKSIEDRTAANPDRHVTHIFGPGIIRVTGDTAESRYEYVAYGRVGEDAWQIMSIGRFQNRLVRNGDEWLFSVLHNRAVRSGGIGIPKT
jgi:uncharacterized protein (TIGR02246 family)